MFFTYLRRELSGRRKQTAIIASGMALAIALVIIVNGVAAGMKAAQAQVLEGIYGVGTDMTVTATPVQNANGQGGRQQFDIGGGAAIAGGGTQNVSVSRLISSPGATTMEAATLAKVQAVSGVSGAAATLSLENVNFSGQLAVAGQTRIPGQGTGRNATPETQQLNRGGTDGAGGSSFNVNRITVLGVDLSAAAIGPLSTISVTDGVGLTAADATANKALVDATYATNNTLSVGGTINLGGTDFAIVGLVTNSTSDSSTSSNVYVPLGIAQSLSGLTDKVSTIYVQAKDNNQISAVQTAIKADVSGVTVKTQADLASSVSGSLTSAATLIESLGLWLSIAVLAAAFLIAILFTISGVTRRTREFGTLKAIGWTNGRITGQVAGESLVQGIFGGIIGVVVGLIGIVVVNAFSPSFTASTVANNRPQGGPGGGFGQAAGQAGQAMQGAAGTAATAAPGAGGGAGANAASTLSTIQIHLPVEFTIIGIAVGLSILGGLLAGAIGGWRASRLSPAEALRSVN
jgi:putative ABC transport system permease protein